MDNSIKKSNNGAKILSSSFNEHFWMNFLENFFLHVLIETIIQIRFLSINFRNFIWSQKFCWFHKIFQSWIRFLISTSSNYSLKIFNRNPLDVVWDFYEVSYILDCRQNWLRFNYTQNHLLLSFKTNEL